MLVHQRVSQLRCFLFPRSQVTRFSQAHCMVDAEPNAATNVATGLPISQVGGKKS